jgi:lysyl-tRNA synthetase class 2
MSEVGKSEAQLIENRIEKAEKLRKMKINPYPAKSDKEYLNSRVLEIYTELIASAQTIVVAGRVMAERGHGKLLFLDIVDQSGKLQVIVKADVAKRDQKIVELIDIGDFIEVSGQVILSNSGEVSLLAKRVKILTKSIRPLPSLWHGIKDEETRYRRRYLDILLNPELKELFTKKAKFWQVIRNFLVERGFAEVETPVLETTTGGADANPFATHHDALDIDVYLRISMGELWQKRLLVAGFDKTFEIGRQFRNEGISREHLQDYSQMEFYWGYASYVEAMGMVEDLYKTIAKGVFGTTKFEINGFSVDLSKKWQKLDYVQTIRRYLKIDVPAASDTELRNKIVKLRLEHKKSDTRGRMIDTLWKSIRGTVAGPAFLINHPVEVSPLAKRVEKNPKLTERYQIIVAGSELGNGYSELNDPVDQRERFLEQAKMREQGDSEAQMNDEDFVEALEYGMPPATGFGLSERLFAFLAGKSVRECQLFPLVRPEIQKEPNRHKSSFTNKHK